mgnify:CR=1 FL=1
MFQFPINHDRALNIDIPQGGEEWDFIRRCRIASSRTGKIVLFSKTEEEKVKTARIICGLEKEVFSDEAKDRMNVGVEYESTIRDSYTKTTGMKIFETGTCIFRQNPIFSGSPDGVFENGDVLEIKITEKELPDFYCSDYSEIPLWYYYQMQSNMFILDSTKCHYVCYSRSSGKMYTRIIPYDHERYINEVYIPCCIFYRDYIKPLIEQYCLKSPHQDYLERNI